MRVKPLPKSWLIHTIEYKGFTGQKDSWNKPVYDAPIPISFVRVDSSTVFSRDTTQTKIVANAVIFVDAVNSNPIPIFKEESKITFNGKDLTLKKIIPCYYPQQNEVRHYELEVV
ncbi:MAG: putative minor capsid protein [Psychrobacillus psychrodurans]